MTVNALQAFVERLGDPKLAPIHRIQTVLLTEMQSYAKRRGFVQLMPVLMSPFTDPLNHSVYPADIRYEDHQLRLTASMIFHKQLALIPPDMERILIVSPNIRLEKREIKDSANHLLEFSQFDFEVRNAKIEDVMEFIEGLLTHAFTALREECGRDLKRIGRELPTLTPPFPRYRSEALRERYGDDFEKRISAESRTPVFVVNFKREFYDREDPEARGTYRNFDLIYPEGYGEALSGAEREYEYESIVRRMEELNMNLGKFASYLEIARQGRIPPTAGAGIGIQRLMRFICGVPRISDVCVFDRSLSTDFVV